MKVDHTVAALRGQKKRDRTLHHPPEGLEADPLPSPGAVSEPDQPFEEGVHDSIDPDLRHRLISEAAFDLYARRGFADGFDVEDWLSAEARVDHLLLNPQFVEGQSRG